MRSGKKLLPILRWAMAEFGETNMGLYATSGAYYLFFSLGPLVVVFLALMPYLPITDQDVMGLLMTYAPPQFQELVSQIVADMYAGSAVALGAGLVMELWSAGKFLSLVMRGVAQVYGAKPHGGFLLQRLLAALYTLALVVLVLGDMLLLFFGEKILTSVLPENVHFWAVLLQMRVLVFIAVVTAVNALLYRYVPERDLSFRAQLPGAAFSALAWLGFSRLYSWAVDRFSMYSVYGGMAIVIVSLFWIYSSLYIFFLGGWLNTLPDRWRGRI